MHNDTSNLNDTFLEVPIEPISHPLNRLPGVEHVLDRKKINVLTYNIFLRPPLIKNNRDDFKDERLKDFIRLLGDYDIICLQEMFGLLNKRKHKLIRCAAKAGFLHYTDSPSPSFFNSYVVDGGLLTLSRFPILATEFKPYPYGIFSDSLAQKGALYNKIEVRGEVLHIFSTHTQASYFGENQRYPILTRADQFATLRKFVETTLKKQEYKDGELVLLLGDFNVDSKKPFIETSKIKYYPGFQDYCHLGRQDFFNEYEAMMCYLSNNHKDDIEDLLLEAYGEHPITYAESWINGNNETKPMETVLTRKDDLCSNQSLDYIFNLTPKSIMRKGNRNRRDDGELRRGRLHIVKDSARVEKFLITSKDVTQLSDHYGLVVSLEYKENEDYEGNSSMSLRSRSAILDNLHEDQITVNMG